MAGNDDDDGNNNNNNNNLFSYLGFWKISFKGQKLKFDVSTRVSSCLLTTPASRSKNELQKSAVLWKALLKEAVEVT